MQDSSMDGVRSAPRFVQGEPYEWWIWQIAVQGLDGDMGTAALARGWHADLGTTA